MLKFKESQNINHRLGSVLKPVYVSLTLLLKVSLGSSTDLNNIESITPSGTNPISITGDLDLNSNNINNFFGSSCSTGNIVAHINDDGTLDCVDATSEVQNDFVDRSGDSMTGNLDLGGNSLNNVDWANSDNPNTDSQQLSISGDTISLDNGGSVTIQDDTIADDQTLSTTADVSGTDDQITIDNGNSVTIDDDFEANTNTQLDDEAAQSNVNMNGNDITNAGIINSEGVNVQETTPSNGGLTSGWYTIASNDGDRASAKFVVKDQESGEHSATHFYAAHHYGNANTINVLSESDYGQGCIGEIRIKSGGTYDGALLQIYLNYDSCGGVQAMMTENLQNGGWELRDWISSDPISGLSETTRVNLNQGPSHSVRFTGGIRTQGQIDASSASMRLPTGADSW